MLHPIATIPISPHRRVDVGVTACMGEPAAWLVEVDAQGQPSATIAIPLAAIATIAAALRDAEAVARANDPR
jgi:hypothetical protein